MRKTLFILFISVLFISCSLFTKENDGYEEALATWTEQKQNNYAFQYDMRCFCALAPSAEIIVRSDSVYQILNPETGDSLFFQTSENMFQYVGDVYPDLYYTIDGFFDIINRARKEADNVEVNYNDEIGFPESIQIDYDKNAIDDEVGHSISNYRPLAGDFFTERN